MTDTLQQSCQESWPKSWTRSWQDQDLLSWLGKEAPRYTSYPSAHHFESVAPQTYTTWLANLRPDQSIGLYVHIPFCEQMCWFCGCNTQITLRYEPVKTYVDSLVAEIAMISAVLGFRPKVHALHFGGGSPGLLQPQTLGTLMDALRDAFDLIEAMEISIELDPRRITPDRVAAYAAQGFNRVSLGVQDTQPQVQAAINRVQPLDLVRDAAERLRSAGIVNLGIDLVYGLPHQTAASLEQTIADIAGLEPARVSAFSYAHVPWVKKHQRLIDASTLPDLNEKATQYLQIDSQFQALGYAAVGMDHFARGDDGLARAAKDGTLRRNFMGYTDLPNDRLVALGASSISELDDGIAQNIAQATSYESRIAAGQLPTTRGWAYREDDRARRDVISQLMCFFRVDLAATALRHGLAPDYFDEDLVGLRDFVAAGLVRVTDRVVLFDAPLKMLVRLVAAAFDLYARQDGGGNRYSRVA